jgi:hypothetical protein
MVGEPELPEASKINGCDSETAVLNPAKPPANPKQCRTYDTPASRLNLRQGFIAGALDAVGDNFVVIVERKVNTRIDGRAMREQVAESVWRPYLVEKAVDYVNVRRRD